MENSSFGKRIKEYRLMLGLSQQALAEKAGYTDKSAISVIEQGRVDVPYSKLIALAAALNVAPGNLLDGESCKQKDFDRNLVHAFHRADPVTQQNVCLLLGVSREDEAAGLSNSKIDA